jgi:hypothetical protein
MKSMLLTLMMVMGLAINYSNAQVANCQPCPPGCCVTKGCTPADCAKLGCDISKCKTSDASATQVSAKDAKMCCATGASAKTSNTANTKMCSAADAKTTTSFITAVSLIVPSQAPKTNIASVASLSTPSGQ